jgi:5-hydroxyisourate hydrolase
MNSISTHVLDTALGGAAAGVPVHLERHMGDGWFTLGRGHTDADGRHAGLLGGAPLEAGRYRLTFGIAEYHANIGVEGFYPQAVVEFIVRDPTSHHHVPLLLSPFGYSTYRGS